MTNHFAKECRASEEKRKAWKAKQQRGGVSDLSEEAAPDMESLGAFAMYPFDLDHTRGDRHLDTVYHNMNDDRKDATERTITFAVDSAACVTAVSTNHRAARGYKTWRDKNHGREYSCANYSPTCAKPG